MKENVFLYLPLNLFLFSSSTPFLLLPVTSESPMSTVLFPDGMSEDFYPLHRIISDRPPGQTEWRCGFFRNRSGISVSSLGVSRSRMTCHWVRHRMMTLTSSIYCRRGRQRKEINAGPFILIG
ncbi:hypothetical protein TNCT_666701 [Trichonephila clavata]|uniref:Secreted protein n=1 Tax=Trichonephila clavata TaxID=2740835 RepID=A0A8X6GFL4_TRICU|nr:hypothetical protein TNCT_666701 [Trichonephila clavata]